MSRSLSRGLFGVALAVVSSACSSSLSLDAAATGEARILMSRDTSPSFMSAPAESPEGARSVEQDTVQSLVVTVVGIDVLLEGASDTSATSSAWTSLDLSSSFDLNLMALPTGDAAAQLVASGAVRAGTYTHVRLRVTNPRIVFKGDVSFGAGGILEGGAEYAVVIPSSQQTGIKVAVGVTVEADASTDIALVFDSAESLSNVAITGTGQVIMSPVIRVR